MSEESTSTLVPLSQEGPNLNGYPLPLGSQEDGAGSSQEDDVSEDDS